jgi:spermidine synthase
MIDRHHVGVARRTPNRGPTAGEWPVETGTLAFVPDGDGRNGWTVVVNGVPSSHVDLDDPLRLDFEYMRWTGDLLDVLAPPGEALRVTHVGGAGCSLPRYVAATRPASVQVVLEHDPAILDAVRAAFGLRSGRRLRLRAADGREGLAELADASQDVLIRDAFSGAAVPEHLRTRGFVREVLRVIGDGVYVANLADVPPMANSRTEAATALAEFRHVALAAEPAQFKGRRYGNVLLVASQRPLPLEAFGRRLASGAVRARLLGPGEVRAMAAGRRPQEDPAEAG